MATSTSTTTQFYAGSDRGHTNIDWLNSYHTFSFGHYHNPAMMGFGPLRVLNDDRIQGGSGFGTHPHRDMEIISYVVHGGLEHRDSTGGGSVILPGDIQLMRAGSGITHSEYNHSATDTTRFLQIWVEPAVRGLAPGYQQTRIAGEDYLDQWRLLVSPDGADGSLEVAQNMSMWARQFTAGQQWRGPVERGDDSRKTWLQVVSGTITVNEQQLSEGDAMSFDQQQFNASSSSDGEVLFFDLPNN